MSAKIEIRETKVPPFVLKALEQRRGNFSEMRHLFHCVWLYGAADDPEKFTCVGVAGDGDNGGYEWFRWKGGKFTCTDAGYGCTATALLHGLSSEASL